GPAVADRRVRQRGAPTLRPADLRHGRGVPQVGLVELPRLPARARTPLCEGLRVPGLLQRRQPARRRRGGFFRDAHLARRGPIPSGPRARGLRRAQPAAELPARHVNPEAPRALELDYGPAVRPGEVHRPRRARFREPVDRRLAGGGAGVAALELLRASDLDLPDRPEGRALRLSVSDPG